MNISRKFGALFVFMLVAAVGAMGYVRSFQVPAPEIEALLAFTIVAFLLDQGSTKLSGGGFGSTSFVVHLAAGITFGAFWGGMITGVATLLSLAAIRMAPVRIAFNVSQRTLSTVLAVLVYLALGGAIPPISLQESLFPFLAMSATYFLVNASAVTAGICLNYGRLFREVWNLNSRGVLGYDLAASSIALGLAWVYKDWGLVGLFVAIVPTLAARHTYVMYRELQESGRELLEVMVKAIEARDPYTSGHSLRVSALSRAVAVELGLTAKEIEEVQTAALLHDVGKIYEEFAPVLRKEGRLTPEETALMQTHSTKSAELVGIISKFRGTIQDSVRHHHERWDGQGYPSGLSGKDIPLSARVILLADTIDAMTTDRPYRKRLGLDVVIAELQRCKGTQFEPELVDVAVSSVAVRRLITNPVASMPAGRPGESKEESAPRSKRVSWPSGLWPARRA